jgi:hypothetical protein
MQSNTLNIKNVIFIFLIIMFITNCKGKDDLEGQITIKINSIDRDTKQHRINAFDTIEVRKEGIGYLMKTFDKVGQYVTDSKGSVKIKIDKMEKYMFLLSRRNYFGSETFEGEFLKNGQEVNIEVFPIENR